MKNLLRQMQSGIQLCTPAVAVIPVYGNHEMSIVVYILKSLNIQDNLKSTKLTVLEERLEHICI